MFFNNFIKRILSSLLRPWLEQDLELDLQLGFINSTAVAKNIRLDTSTLNRLIIDGSSSSRFFFKEFVIEEFVVRFSNWSDSAFVFEARGVKVTMSLEEMEEEGTAKVRNSSNAALESLKKDLSLIDPEGSALHDILEAILATTCGRNRFQSSFLNLILQHCRLQILGINLQVQFPTLDDSFVYLLDLEKLNAESLHFVHGCLCKGLVNVLFLPLKEGSLIVSGSSFKIGYKKSNQINHVCSSSALVTCIKLNDLELVEFNLRASELSFSFSPVDFPVFMELSKVPSKEFKRVRNGRYLWRIAAIKIGHVISSPKLSWYKLVSLTSLWMHYVNHYEYLLSLIQYSPNHLLERPDIKMLRDKVNLKSAKHYWEVIFDIEKELPAEAIAQARKIARYKALSSGEQPENYSEPSVSAHFKTFVQKVMQKIHPLEHLLFWRRSAKQDEMFARHLGNVSDNSYSRFRFILSLGKIYITLSSMSAVEPVNEKVKSRIGISYSDGFLFRLSIKVFLLMYTKDIFKQTLSFSCGKVKVKYFISSVGEENERVKNLKVILHGEPAKIFLFSESNKSSTINHAEGGCDPCLENFIGKMCLDWIRDCEQFEESEIKCPQSPQLLFEMKSFLRHPDLKKLGSGLWKCNLTVGKFNIALQYPSVISVVMLLRQIQHALHWTQGNESARDLPYSPQNTTVHQPEDSWENKYECYSSKIKKFFTIMLPGKCIQIGVLIAGPCIQLSSRKTGTRNANEGVNNHVVNEDDFHLGFDIHDIEVVVWPSSKSGLAPIHAFTEQDDEYPECLRLQEPKILDMPKLENNKYTSKDANSLHFCLKLNGLLAYLVDTVDRHKNQIFVLDPITFRFSSFRQCAHSFSTSSIAFSTAFYGLAMGFALLLFMDELCVCFQALTGLSSDLSHICNNFGSPANESFQMLRHYRVSGATKDEELSIATPLMCNNTFLINGIIKLKSMDLFLCGSRIRNKARGSKMVFGAASSTNSAADNLSDCGIWISLPRMCFDILYEEMKLELLIDLSGIQSVIVRYQEYIKKRFNRSAFRAFLLCSHNCLYEVFLSHCIFTLLLSMPQNSTSASVNEMLDISTSEVSTSNMAEDTSFSSELQPSVQSPDFLKNLGFTSNISVPASSHWIFMKMEVAEVFVTRCSVKNILIGAQKVNKLRSSLHVGAKSQAIAWGIQDGFLCLETEALAMFIQCSASYLHHIKNALSIVKSTVRSKPRPAHDHFVGGHAQEMLLTSQQVKWELPEAFNFDVSQFSLALVVESESCHIREFVLELDLILNLDLDNMQQKFMLKLSRLSVFSQDIRQSGEDKIQVFNFSSAQSNLPSQRLSGESAVAFQRDGSFRVDDSYPRASVSEGAFCLRYQGYILKHLTASLSVEKGKVIPLDPEQVWVGSGSVSGFDMKISLSELEMILSMVSSFSGLSLKGSTGQSVQRNWSYNTPDDNDFEARIPNGAIVAIQDVHQHLYFTVEGGENKYAVGGSVHYSFVGERALFRVKYHKQRKWNSSVLWFSLISLHAKDNSGEPLRLNSKPGSGFVELSSTSDNAWSLWRVLFYQPTYDGDIDWEPYNCVLRNSFYLVNKKNDCAVAFNDRVPVFVKKPGNPLKFKGLSDMSVAQDVAETEINLGAHEDGKRSYGQRGNLPCIGISIDKVSLTIFHELSDANDRFPLLHACIFDTQITLQILSTKTRVISTSKALLQHFDAQANFWRDFLHPVEICTFYRSSPQNQHGVPVHVYCRTKELEISLTELSLDILLFVVGKLNLAGPFSLRSSMILANCCKVENQTGLNLLCRFSGKQSVTVGRKQSSSIFLRLSAFESQPPETEPVVSIQLSVPGSFTTSPVHLSLLGAQVLSWRTRILSLQDSKSYPGPFIVVDISRKQEDGLSIVVSPLIRIQNETKLSIELRIRRPERMEDEFASMSLKAGDTFDDSMASFDAIHFSGGFRKALMSLNVGNFLFSFRPEMSHDLIQSDTSLSVEWSDEIKGGKAIRLSGIFDKLSYEVRKALSVGSVKCSFSTASCTVKSAAGHVSNMHFLIQSIGREVPIMKPDKSKDGLENRNAPISLQEQKEICILPTVRVSNLLHSEIHVLLTETNSCTPTGHDNIGKEATLPCRSTVDFYANPAIMYFLVSLTAFSSTSKPVNSGEWVKKLLKHKTGVRCLDIDLDFCGGKYFASLRLSRGYKGILEATVYTPYILKNETDFSMFFFASGQKPPFRNEMEGIRPELGLFLPPKSTGSWFLRSCKMHLRLFENPASEPQIDLDTLSGPTEVSLEIAERSGVKYIAKFGVSIAPSLNSVVPSQTITIAPRHVVLNESEENITVRQCNLEVDTAGMISINSRQSAALLLQKEIGKRAEYSLFENIIKKHRNDFDSSLIYIQFRLNESQLDWSGPLCITSLGRFFLKFRKHSSQLTAEDKKIAEFAEVHVVEEGSTIVVRFQKPPSSKLPYRIENYLHGASLTYYQKNSSESEFLGSECFVDYTWDDVTLPRKLVVILNDMNLPREINLDKVRTWKPFYKLTQERLASHILFDKKSKGKRSRFGEHQGMNAVRVGYEVYADGPTRVLRICEFSDSHKQDKAFHSCAKIRMRVSQFAIQLLEKAKEDLNQSGTLCYTPFAVARLHNISLDSLFMDQQKYNQIAVQSLTVDVKWMGAPVASMLRRHRLDDSDANDSMLKIIFVLLSAGADVKQVKYASVILQPIDLNIDEDTLMKIVSFWRTSLSDSSSPSQQFYFDNFEIHPIKIIATFVPGESYSSYNSAQEALRTLLHSVVKVPPIKKVAVELNGVSVTHALVTIRELLIRCAQHYSWYAMRSISIAKGSQLLPPAFASIFDDLASSSLDIFFDPSQGLMNLPGFKWGTFKFISRCIDGKGFSGTKRYFGDLGKTLKTAGSNVIFAAVTEISDSVLKGAEASGFNGMVSGFHQGILKLAMEPSVLGTALMGSGPDRKIKLDRSPGVDELYIEGYLQAMLDSMYRQEYLRVRVIDDQVFLKNLPPNSSLINEIMDSVKGFLISKALLKGDPATASRPFRNVQGESEWRIGPTIITLCEHLFVSFAIRKLRSQADKYIAIIKSKKEAEKDEAKEIVPADTGEVQKVRFIWKWGIAKFVLSGILAYIDGRLCRSIPNPVARRIVSGFLLSFLDQS
ncbi:hypothetical protein ES332_D11G215800v1 [Gossypium tomentosum]|uniref:Vacuolar protein sorting-associated protein 13 VPS13 adaptor binding domain-containing protein n=1 Tax=Gossypium tomentosum TaxID=34277 RepID=A0A5D2ISB4_GOSTO|nr:hypothetical protein ES332_D11G215800v1 [Gossypium tomentosum]